MKIDNLDKAGVILLLVTVWMFIGLGVLYPEIPTRNEMNGCKPIHVGQAASDLFLWPLVRYNIEKYKADNVD